MNNSKNMGLYAAVIAVSVGVLGAYGFSISSSSLSNTSSVTSEGTPILGHVTAIVTDSSGHIKQYMQGDNAVQINAKDCVGRSLFGNIGSSFSASVCSGALTGNFTKIAISSSGAGGTFGDNLDALTGEYTSFGLARTTASSESATWTDAPHSGSGTEVIQATFTNTDSSSHVVGSAGLFNSTTAGGSGGMFSGQDLTGSGVTLNQNDAITIKWTISIG